MRNVSVVFPTHENDKGLLPTIFLRLVSPYTPLFVVPVTNGGRTLKGGQWEKKKSATNMFVGNNVVHLAGKGGAQKHMTTESLNA